MYGFGTDPTPVICRGQRRRKYAWSFSIETETSFFLGYCHSCSQTLTLCCLTQPTVLYKCNNYSMCAELRRELQLQKYKIKNALSIIILAMFLAKQFCTRELENLYALSKKQLTDPTWSEDETDPAIIFSQAFFMCF